MTLLSSIGLAPKPSPTPAPAPTPAPSPEPTASDSTSGTQATSDSGQTATNTQNTSSGGGSASASEPGVTYQPAPAQSEPVTYSATSPAAQPAAAPTTAPTPSSPEAAPARFSIASGPGGTITEQTASVLAAGKPERAPEQKQAIARPDIAELMAAFTAQFAGSERRNLEMLL